MYRGRFAPSPTGPLHAGSLLAALASWLDARAHDGQWLVRIEDVDTPRCVVGGGEFILHQLASVGLLPDEPPVWQSQRSGLYRAALDHLTGSGLAYPCACSRKDIAEVLQQLGSGKPRHGELVYPGTCRSGLQGREGRAWRLRTDAEKLVPKTAPTHTEYAYTAPDLIANTEQNGWWTWHDRRLGWQQQQLAHEVGDFVLLRADGLWAYQLAVVVDDADQGITHIVRGEDLADNTARQIALQSALGLPTVQYLHTPLELGANGEKLSKQNGATALDLTDPLAALQRAATALGLHRTAGDVSSSLALWTDAWRDLWCLGTRPGR
ncbi:tRNA glutamyl-Q(34) synthetase GluQRS [Rhodoferax sp.]|uniref:tRNA glutamyl-Q(34) synthetase GluQRS n=1 Tax=Rhodoferax sp. TaxID=50421 RepID=UPI0025D1C5D6|nr:tRNA glutamyl-Q(34) synthetase GluQRS [Rhodoferax sp.]